MLEGVGGEREGVYWKNATVGEGRGEGEAKGVSNLKERLGTAKVSWKECHGRR